MKPKSKSTRHSSVLLTICLGLAAVTQSAFATAYTWDGGNGSDPSWALPANWSTDVAPAATGDTLTFAGTNNLSPVNNHVTALATSGTAITFASGAGSFNLSGNTLTLGSGGGGGQTIVSQQSANNQIISANINFTGGSGDRSIVFGSGAGSLTLSGNISFSNDWLFPTTTAGTLILSGNNTGDGKAYNAGGVTAGTNRMNAMMRNNVAGTQLVLGSNTALGNSGSGIASAGTADFRGIVANQQLNISTTGGDRNLSGSSLSINANNITFNGTNNLTIGNIITQGGNRDFNVSSTGAVTVSNGIFLSHDQTGRQLYVNLSGAGGMVVNGTISDTFHSGGVTTGTSTFRKAGTGMMTLNGNSSYTGATQVNAGTLKIGHANALGATGTASATTLTGGTLDLNGFTIGETVNVTGNATLANTGGASQLTADANLTANLAVNATGDITATRFIGTAGTRTITKTGAGNVTTNGTSHNNLVAWDIQAGKVVLANSAGYGADRGVAINGGTLQLGGANSDLVNNDQPFTVNSGVFDLNGKGEAIAAVGGTGGVIRNSLAATTSTLFVGGGSTSASYAGVIEDGAGVMKLTKEGAGTQTLTGVNSYTGATTISAGALALGLNATISDSLILGTATPASGTLDVTAKESFSQADVSGNGTLNIGSDKTITITGDLAPGFSPGTLNVTGNLALASSTSTTLELAGIGGNAGTDSDFVNVTGSLTLDGLLAIVSYGGHDITQNATYDLFDATSFTGEFTGVSVGANSLILAGDLWGGTFSGTTYSFSETTGVLTVVPEPAAALLGAFGLITLLRRRRS